MDQMQDARRNAIKSLVLLELAQQGIAAAAQAAGVTSMTIHATIVDHDGITHNVTASMGGCTIEEVTGNVQEVAAAAAAAAEDKAGAGQGNQQEAAAAAAAAAAGNSSGTTSTAGQPDSPQASSQDAPGSLYTCEVKLYANKKKRKHQVGKQGYDFHLFLRTPEMKRAAMQPVRLGWSSLAEGQMLQKTFKRAKCWADAEPLVKGCSSERQHKKLVALHKTMH